MFRIFKRESIGHGIREAINKNRMKGKRKRSLATTGSLATIRNPMGENPIGEERKEEYTPLMLDF